MTSTRPLRVLIVDDEPLARARLATLVAESLEPRCEVLWQCANAREAAEWLRGHTTDLVLLDIQMPGAPGTALAAELQRAADPPAVVFVTAHGEHALRAFELEATDYLTKPVRRERLQAALQRVYRARQPAPLPTNAGGEPVLVVSDRGRVLRVPVSEALYLKAELKYVTLRTADAEWVLDEPLGDLEPRLKPGFIRVHRNALVALRAVRALERQASAEEPQGWAVVLTNGETLAVSRRQLSSVRDALAAAAGAHATS